MNATGAFWVLTERYCRETMLTVNNVNTRSIGVYGKSFASMYTGSMFGQSALVFAVWGYCITHQRQSRSDGQCYVELNPTMLAPMFSDSVENIMQVLEFLESPDIKSRSKELDGRRLVLVSDEERHSGPMQYRVVNGAFYRALRDEEERREYLKLAKRKSRAKSSTESTTVNHGTPPSAQSDADADAEEERESEPRASRSGGKKAAPIPPDWTPTEAHRALAGEHGIDLALEAVAFRGYFDGQVVKSPNGRFSTWLANAVTRKRERGGGVATRQEPVRKSLRMLT